MRRKSTLNKPVKYVLPAPMVGNAYMVYSTGMRGNAHMGIPNWHMSLGMGTRSIIVTAVGRKYITAFNVPSLVQIRMTKEEWKEAKPAPYAANYTYLRKALSEHVEEHERYIQQYSQAAVKLAARAIAVGRKAIRA